MESGKYHINDYRAQMGLSRLSYHEYEKLGNTINSNLMKHFNILDLGGIVIGITTAN